MPSDTHAKNNMDRGPALFSHYRGKLIVSIPWVFLSIVFNKLAMKEQYIINCVLARFPLSLIEIFGHNFWLSKTDHTSSAHKHNASIM